MNKLLIANLFILLCINLKAQDILFLNDGNEIYAKILKISDTEVEFKKFSNLEGPNYTKSLNAIKEIKFQNGKTERYNHNKVNTNQSKHYIKVTPPINDSVGIAEIQQFNGIDIYILSKPLLEYEIVGYAGDFMTEVQLKNIFSNRGNIRSRTYQLVEAAYNAAKSENEIIHGLIYADGGSVLLIRYTKEPSSSKKLAKVNMMNGKELYVLSKPSKPYQTVKTKAMVTGTLTSFMTFGLIKSAIRDDIERLVNSYDFRKLNYDAVLYEDNYEAAAISF